MAKFVFLDILLLVAIVLILLAVFYTVDQIFLIRKEVDKDKRGRNKNN